jgi:hypothetical protein
MSSRMRKPCKLQGEHANFGSKSIKIKMFLVLNHETFHKFVCETTDIILRLLTSAVDGGE